MEIEEGCMGNGTLRCLLSGRYEHVGRVTLLGGGVAALDWSIPPRKICYDV